MFNCINQSSTHRVWADHNPNPRKYSQAITNPSSNKIPPSKLSGDRYHHRDHNEATQRVNRRSLRYNSGKKSTLSLEQLEELSLALLQFKKLSDLEAWLSDYR